MIIAPITPMMIMAARKKKRGDTSTIICFHGWRIYSYYSESARGERVARSDLMKFWKLLNDAEFTGSPSKLTEGDVRRMAEIIGLPEHEIETVLRGFLEFLKQET